MLEITTYFGLRHFECSVGAGFIRLTLAGAELCLGQAKYYKVLNTAPSQAQNFTSDRSWMKPHSRSGKGLVLLDLVLGGGSAIVIALAARSVPKYLQQRAIIWGTVGAIAVRSWLTMVVVWLLPVHGWMLLWRRDFGVDRPPPAGACRR